LVCKRRVKTEFKNDATPLQKRKKQSSKKKLKIEEIPEIISFREAKRERGRGKKFLQRDT